MLTNGSCHVTIIKPSICTRSCITCNFKRESWTNYTSLQDNGLMNLSMVTAEITYCRQNNQTKVSKVLVTSLVAIVH